ncbi:D-aminoacyl-tRNA deacylase [Bacteroidota bacterium]
MKVALICPSTSIASKNIQESLISLYPFEKKENFYELDVKGKNVRIYSPPKETIFLENIDKEIDGDLFIFPTTHSSRSGIHSLSAHVCGNWGKAELGGSDRELCTAATLYIKESLIKLKELSEGLEFDIVQEVTHHGPYIEKPCFFIEIGSDETQWIRKDAGDILAKTIMLLLENNPKNYKTAVGIGGLHTMPNFNKITFGDEIAIGHCCPKYMLDDLDEELVRQALERTKPKADLVIVDWKGLGPHKEKIKKILEKIKVEWKRTKDF